MKKVPFDREVIDGIIENLRIDVPRASIREMNLLVNLVEQRFDTSFIRMEFGVPGLKTSRLAVEREARDLLEKDITNTYAPISGLPELKQAGSRFAKAFMDLEIPPECVVVTNGAMQGCFVAIGLAGCHDPERRTILFLDPGFPVNKIQTRVLGLRSVNLDLKDYRGEALIRRVDELCGSENVGGCVWSSPNNPAWVVLTEDELRGLAGVFEKHRVMAIEDMAYFGMDFRRDYSVPYRAPFQPSIARYTDRVFILLSSSKLFSYAGQRCGLTLIPESFARESFPFLKNRFAKEKIIEAFVQGGVYPTTASVAQGPQRGLATLLTAAVEGRYNPWQEVREYEVRARAMKKAFTEHGFYLVYDEDLGQPLGDGFYFTIAYPGMSGGTLAKELVYYGISAITLEVTGSRYQGLRACVSLTQADHLPELAYRLARFQEDHP